MKKLINCSKCAKTLLKGFIEKCKNFGKVKIALKSTIPLNTGIDVAKGGELSIGNNTQIRTGCKLAVRKDAKLKIGNSVFLNYNCIFTAYENITIGDGTAFGPNVLIYDHDHKFGNQNELHSDFYKTNPITIGKNVWVGANCIILRGTKIGDNCVIAAGSIVKGTIPDGQLYVQKRESTLSRIEDRV